MKNILLLILPLILLVCSCKPKEVPIPPGYEKFSFYDIEGNVNAKRAIEVGNDFYYETGMLINGIKQGPWITYYHKYEYPRIIANYIDGELNGPYLEFHDYGCMKAKGTCKNGVLDGNYKEYNKDYRTKDQVFVMGVLEGEVKNYYPGTGMRMSTLNYKNGVQHGIATYYNENGLPINEFVYENGEQISSMEIDTLTGEPIIE